MRFATLHLHQVGADFHPLAADPARRTIKRAPGVSRSPKVVPFIVGYYTLKELPQPHVLFTFGLLNLKPAPSSVST
jgi:hypothetical protein